MPQNPAQRQRHRARAAVTIAIVVAFLTGCVTGPSGPGPARQQAGVVKGHVTDSQGRPISGAEVFADNTLFYDANLLATTDENGYYEIRLDADVPGTWRIGGSVTAPVGDGHYRFSLHPVSDETFLGEDGAIRDLEWRLSGRPTPGDSRYYGALVYVYDVSQSEEFLEPESVELTFTPDGPLIDGSDGSPITTSINGYQVEDVPVGDYRVTARYLGSPARDLVLRMRFDEAFQRELPAHFSLDPYGQLILELEFALA